MVELIECDNIYLMFKQFVDELCSEMPGSDECREAREILDGYFCGDEWVERVKEFLRAHSEEAYNELVEYMGG